MSSPEHSGENSQSLPEKIITNTRRAIIPLLAAGMLALAGGGVAMYKMAGGDRSIIERLLDNLKHPQYHAELYRLNKEISERMRIIVPAEEDREGYSEVRRTLFSRLKPPHPEKNHDEIKRPVTELLPFSALPPFYKTLLTLFAPEAGHIFDGNRIYLRYDSGMRKPAECKNIQIEGDDYREYDDDSVGNAQVIILGAPVLNSGQGKDFEALMTVLAITHEALGHSVFDAVYDAGRTEDQAGSEDERERQTRALRDFCTRFPVKVKGEVFSYYQQGRMIEWLMGEGGKKYSELGEIVKREMAKENGSGLLKSIYFPLYQTSRRSGDWQPFAEKIVDDHGDRVGIVYIVDYANRYSYESGCAELLEKGFEAAIISEEPSVLERAY